MGTLLGRPCARTVNCPTSALATTDERPVSLYPPVQSRIDMSCHAFAPVLRFNHVVVVYVQLSSFFRVVC